MKNKYLLMWLEAPLQSWGYDSKFSRRDTLNFPTKSGVFGLICCSLGAGGEQKNLLARMSSMRLTVCAFARNVNKEPGESSLLRDFHMVGSGYNRSDTFQNQLIPKTREGKQAVGSGGGVKLTYRSYLQDSAFGVVCEVPEDLSEIFSRSLANPVWDLYLGRKSCAPTDIIYRGTYSTEEEALGQALGIAKEKALIEKFRVLEGKQEGEQLTLNDVPIQFGEHKQYQKRHITIVYHD